MESRELVFFVSDVHLGMEAKDPAERETRFVCFLDSIPAVRTKALFLLGDVWDFWFEYKDVVPKGYVKVFASLIKLMEAGVEVYFFRGNHEFWSYHYFEELGMKPLKQPYFVEFGGKTFCLGHGDGLGEKQYRYKLMKKVLCSGFLKALMLIMHPRFIFWAGHTSSRNSRLSRDIRYKFQNEKEPLYKFAEKLSESRKVDYFIFGHYHCPVDLKMDTGARFLLLGDWVDDSQYLYFDGISVFSGHSQYTE